MPGADAGICERVLVPPVSLLFRFSLSHLPPLSSLLEVGLLTLNQLEGLGSAVSSSSEV